jgi:hypothetical protein
MNFFYEIFNAHPIVSVAQTVFMIWMAVDVYRRRSDQFWYWVIFFVPVLGAWVYFFAIVAPQLATTGNLSSLFERKVSLAELRYRAEQAPTLANNLALSQALMAKGIFAEALPFLEAAYQVEPEHGSVLFGLAKCHLHEGTYPQAASFLERIIKREPRWSDYEAWRLLIETKLDAGQDDEALNTARELVKISPSLRNRCLLGELLIDQSYKGEARALLQQAIDDHTFTPVTLRRHNRVWARKAGRLLKKL